MLFVFTSFLRYVVPPWVHIHVTNQVRVCSFLRSFIPSITHSFPYILSLCLSSTYSIKSILRTVLTLTYIYTHQSTQTIQWRPYTKAHTYYVRPFIPTINGPSGCHSFIYSFIHSFIHAFIHSPVHYSFIHSFVYSFIHSFIHSFIRLVIHSFIYSFIRSLVYPSIHTFVRFSYFVPAFMFSFTQRT